jgi:ribosomal protein L29
MSDDTTMLNLRTAWRKSNEDALRAEIARLRAQIATLQSENAELREMALHRRQISQDGR